MIQRWLRHLALTLALLFAQQGAALHELEHLADQAAEHSEQDKHSPHFPHSPHCAKCLAYAAVGSAAASAPLAFDGIAAAPIPVAEEIIPAFSTPLYAYRSRAPPRSA